MFAAAINNTENLPFPDAGLEDDYDRLIALADVVAKKREVAQPGKSSYCLIILWYALTADTQCCDLQGCSSTGD
jgi:hypothetical protein